MDLTLTIDQETLERLNQALLNSTDINDKAIYALLLGLKVIESGIDSDKLIRGLQESGVGLDLPLMMAKKNTRDDKQRPQETDIAKMGEDPYMTASFGEISAGAYYDTEFEED